MSERDVENHEKLDLIRAARRATELLLEHALEFRLNLLRTAQVVETATGATRHELGSCEQDMAGLVSALRWVLLDLDAMEDGRQLPLTMLRRLGP